MAGCSHPEKSTRVVFCEILAKRGGGQVSGKLINPTWFADTRRARQLDIIYF